MFFLPNKAEKNTRETNQFNEKEKGITRFSLLSDILRGESSRNELNLIESNLIENARLRIFVLFIFGFCCFAHKETGNSQHWKTYG